MPCRHGNAREIWRTEQEGKLKNELNGASQNRV